MQDNSISFTLQDLIQREWEQFILAVEPNDYFHYSQIFQTQATQARNSLDFIGAEVFIFLSNITSTWWFDIENVSLLYENGNLNKYLKQVGENLSRNILSDQHLQLLDKLLETISNPAMQARVADILWICKPTLEKGRLPQIAKIAVEAYLKSAKNFESIDDDWTKSASSELVSRLHRAAQIAVLIDGSKKVEMQCKVVEYIDKIIDRYKETKSEFLTGDVMIILQGELRKSLPNLFEDLPSIAIKYASISAQKADLEWIRQDYRYGFYDIIAYRKIESEWYKIIGNKDAERQARIAMAEANVWCADKAIEMKEPIYWAVAACRIETAITEYRKIDDNSTFGRRSDTSERIEQLHIQMLGYQRQAREQMPVVQMEFDCSDPEMQETARNLVAGKGLKDALYSLAFGCRGLIMNVDQLCSQVERRNESGNLRNLLPTVLVDYEGKTKTVSGTGDESYEDQMFEDAKMYKLWFGFNFVEVACKQICSEHDVELKDLSFLVNNNPFIPEGHESLYARGFLAGLQSDSVIAMHLLVPQLENSLRHILKGHGFIASELSFERIQDDYTLGKVLRLPELQQILPKDIIFALRGLLTERMGSNIRNELCHGLFSQSAFDGGFDMNYLWWLVLCLCLKPNINQ